MVMRSDAVHDLEAVLASEIEFVDSQTDDGWLIGAVSNNTVNVRMGNFPDEDMWSLWLGNGRWMDFTECPSNWTITLTAGGWPASARPRLPKGEFYE